MYNNGDMSQKEMQEKLDIQSGSMSELINKLENKIERIEEIISKIFY